MRLKTLGVHNFRKFESQYFAFNPRFNVLIGRNASGKTSLLDAASLILGVYQSKVLRRDRALRGIKSNEARVVDYRSNDGQIRREKQFPVSVVSELEYRNMPFAQTCVQNAETGRTTFGGKTEFSQRAREDGVNVAKGVPIILPFLGYYGVGRATTLYNNASLTPVESRLDGYKKSLDPHSGFEVFQGWLKRQTLIQIQNRNVDAPLELTRKAAIALIPNCTDVKFDFNYDSVFLDFEYERSSISFANLSDGFRCVVSMVADMARRISVLNPDLGLEALEKTPGVVLIDELDLYLHPEWQRRIVGDLKKVFPALQFIVTTHSPFIIQSAEPGEALDLERCQGATDDSSQVGFFAERSTAYPNPIVDYSDRSIEDVAEDVMKVPIPQRSEKFRRMYDTAKEYYVLLEQGRSASSQDKEYLKNKLDELIAPFSSEVAYCAFLEMKRMKALSF